MEKLDRDAPLRAASANVHSKVFDDEVVILDMKSGTYFSLRGSGVDVWKLIEENASAAMISEALLERYDAPPGEIDTALDSLLGELAGSGLVVSDASLDLSRPAAQAAEKVPFAPPRIERFTDMQELLLLDPIHEVDDAGWPHTPMTS